MADPIQNLQGTTTVQLPEGHITKAEVARRLQKGRRTIDNWMKEGRLPYYKIGKSVTFKWSEIEAHLRDIYRVCRR